MTGFARYDGLADRYDREFQPTPLEGEAWETLVRLLGRYADVPGISDSQSSLRLRVGATHLPLGRFAFRDAGLRLRREYPYLLALRWCR